MIRKTFVAFLMTGLMLAGVGLVGCSDDTQRVITGPGSGSLDALVTNTDGFATDNDFAYDDWPVFEETDDEVALDPTRPDSRTEDTRPGRKPVDDEPEI